jgi:hypothetical protein
MPSRPFAKHIQKPKLKCGGSISYDKKIKSLSDGEFKEY